VKRLVASASLIVGAAGASALIYAWQPALEPIDPPSASSFASTVVRKGAELAAIGDCQVCHTAPGGRAFAGGLAMETPFGTIYSTNITPHAETGIGRWSLPTFRRALREGVDRTGQHLYPAFPYDHYTLISDADVEALYAFFMTREPVDAKAPPNDLPFPLNVRTMLAGWKLLFFRDERFVADASRDDQWNRGKYLVEGLGHCGACHSPRNLMGAEQRSRAFEGGEAEGWRAYALGRSSQSPVPWNEASLTQYLAEGFEPLHGVARSSMAVVASNLAGVARQDVAAMAHYLASFSRPGDPKAGNAAAAVSANPRGPGVMPQSAGVQAATPAASADEGARLYAAACASCHEGGRALPLGGVQLSLSTAVGGESPQNLISIVLDGLPASDGVSGPIMPGFGAVLTDRQLADLIRYLRGGISHRAQWPDLDSALRNARLARRAEGTTR